MSQNVTANLLGYIGFQGLLKCQLYSIVSSLFRFDKMFNWGLGNSYTESLKSLLAGGCRCFQLSSKGIEGEL